jgi:hypothetical protein
VSGRLHPVWPQISAGHTRPEVIIDLRTDSQSKPSKRPGVDEAWSAASVSSLPSDP